MRIVKDVAVMQRLARTWRDRRRRIGFVPTMGCLHQGHLSLVQRARREVGPRGIVVVSIYVNPTQFGPAEDFTRYPRTFARDRKLCREEGVDVIFFPPDAAMYPGREAGLYSTYVTEESLSRTMEGGARPLHFRGVTTVVAKLFNIVLPDVAVFGAKDFQQAAILRRMVNDLNFPVRFVVAPTVREPDGLAMSSRNQYLCEDERRQARVLWQAIQRARTAMRRSKRGWNADRLQADLERFIEAQPAARVDYIEFFDPQTLHALRTVRHGAHMALAVFIGRTRLIDNARL